MEGVNYSQVLIVLNGVLVGIVAFLLQRLVVKFDHMEKSINELNINLARVIERQDFHHDRLHGQDIFQERIDKELKDVRTRLHDLGNILNGVSGKLELHRETCPHKLKMEKMEG